LSAGAFEVRATRGSIRSMIPVMPVTLHRSAEITVGVPLEKALALFTAEGERRWADGWDPRYPQPDRRDGPGAVFTTAHGSHQTTWIMVDHRPDGLRYARVTHGMTAGTVAVDAVASRDDATQVRVTYDLTALSTAGETWLAAFDAAYDTEIASWATDIAAAPSSS
jgi:hypothetical protein